MMTAAIVCWSIAYGLGVMNTLWDHFDQLSFETQPDTEISEFLFVFYATFMAFLWPLYWTGRALYTVPNLMLPPPGDSL